MTRTTICLVLLLVLSFPAGSQWLTGYGFAVGPTAANQSWHYAFNDRDLSTDTRWGIDVGGHAEVYTLSSFTVTGGIHFVQRGFSVTYPVTTEQFPEGNGEFITVTPRSEYLSFPLVVRYRHAMNGWSPYLVAGPRFDILIARAGNGFQSVVDQFSWFDWGGSVGAGVELPVVGQSALMVELAYNPGFHDIFNNGLLAVRNHSFSMTAGMIFR